MCTPSARLDVVHQIFSGDYKYFLETTNIFPLQVKSHVRGMTVGLNQDTLGGILKVCITRYLYSIYNTIYTLSTVL